MAANSRFYIVVHILILLAMYPDERLTSENIAQSVGTNPVIIRRLMGMLRRARLVAARTGAGGGFELAKFPEGIPLSTVYRVVETHAVLEPHAQPSQCCLVGKHILEAMKGIAGSIELSIDNTLCETTVADMVEHIRQLDRNE